MSAFRADTGADTTMALKLTRRIAETAAAPTDGNPYAITYDTAVRGLGIRVTKAGHRAWILNYRTATGVERRQTIGDLDDWPLDLVRNEARRLRRLVDQGQDPLAERRNRIRKIFERYFAAAQSTGA